MTGRADTPTGATGTPRVVGLDLSLTATGWATPEASGVYHPPRKMAGCERLAHLRDQIMNVRYGPWGTISDDGQGNVTTGLLPVDLVVIEDYAYSRANQAHQIGELGGVIRLAFHEAQVPFVVAAPTARAKYATGKGTAGKSEVLAAAIRRLGYEGHDDNEADALWLRAMGLDALGHPLVTMPAVNRAALESVAWPGAKT